LALAIVLLIGAGLMVKSFLKMYTNPSGFAPEKTLVMKIALSGPEYCEQVSYFRELLDRVSSMPGVRSFGIANSQYYILRAATSSNPPPVDEFRDNLVSAGYFQAIGMHLLNGRWFRDTDPPDATLINETMARRGFGNTDPVGQGIDRLGRSVRVIGVVANLKYAKLDAEPGPEIYRPYSPNLVGGKYYDDTRNSNGRGPAGACSGVA
jgi:putative ABC transport system permease protein